MYHYPTADVSTPAVSVSPYSSIPIRTAATIGSSSPSPLSYSPSPSPLAHIAPILRAQPQPLQLQSIPIRIAHPQPAPQFRIQPIQPQQPQARRLPLLLPKYPTTPQQVSTPISVPLSYLVASTHPLAQGPIPFQASTSNRLIDAGGFSSSHLQFDTNTQSISDSGPAPAPAPATPTSSSPPSDILAWFWDNFGFLVQPQTASSAEPPPSNSESSDLLSLQQVDSDKMRHGRRDYEDRHRRIHRDDERYRERDRERTHEREGSSSRFSRRSDPYDSRSRSHRDRDERKSSHHHRRDHSDHRKSSSSSGSDRERASKSTSTSSHSSSRSSPSYPHHLTLPSLSSFTPLPALSIPSLSPAPLLPSIPFQIDSKTTYGYQPTSLTESVFDNSKSTAQLISRGLAPIPDEDSFMLYQDPYYEIVERLHVHRVAPRDKNIVIYFDVAPETIDSTRRPENNRRIHVRLFSNYTKSEQQWVQEQHLMFNGSPVELPKPLRRFKPNHSTANIFFGYHSLDITSRTLRPSKNVLNFTNAKGMDGFIVVQMVKELSIDELLAKIPTEEQPFQATEEERDMEVTSELSLVDSLSQERIRTAGRGRKCLHRKCFDLQFFLEFCRRQQMWNCPICNHSLPFRDLVRDLVFQKILETVKGDKVVINPDGSYTTAPLARSKSNVSSATTSTASSSVATPPRLTPLIDLDDANSLRSELGSISPPPHGFFTSPASNPFLPPSSSSLSPANSSASSSAGDYTERDGVIILDDD